MSGDSGEVLVLMDGRKDLSERTREGERDRTSEERERESENEREREREGLRLRRHPLGTFYPCIVALRSLTPRRLHNEAVTRYCPKIINLLPGINIPSLTSY